MNKLLLVMAMSIAAHSVQVLPVLADVTVERVTRFGGTDGVGSNEVATVSKIKGSKKRDIGTIRVTGDLARLMKKKSVDMGNDSIIDIAKNIIWKLDHNKYAYSESRLSDFRKTQNKQDGATIEEQPREETRVSVIRNEVTVKDTGETETINDFDCRHYLVTWTVETEDAKTKERAASTMTADLWNTPEEGAVKILRREELDFTRAFLAAIGVDPARAEVNSFGLVALSGILGGDDKAVDESAKELRAKLAGVKGFPILLMVTWQSSGSREAHAKDNRLEGFSGEKEARPEAGGKKKSDLSRRSYQAGSTVIFDAYVEVKKIDASTLVDGEFQIPSGYKPVSR